MLQDILGEPRWEALGAGEKSGGTITAALPEGLTGSVQDMQVLLVEGIGVRGQGSECRGPTSTTLVFLVDGRASPYGPRPCGRRPVSQRCPPDTRHAWGAVCGRTAGNPVHNFCSYAGSRTTPGGSTASAACASIGSTGGPSTTAALPRSHRPPAASLTRTRSHGLDDAGRRSVNRVVLCQRGLSIATEGCLILEAQTNEKEAAMIARVAVWEPMPTDDRGWVLDAAAGTSGVHGAYHLIDPATGNGLSVAFFEDEAAAHAAHKAIEKRAEEIGWNNVPHPAPVSQTIYQVVRHV